MAVDSGAIHPTKLFIGGISRHTTTKMLREHFSQYSRVLDCVAMRQPDGRSRGFGYVTVCSRAAADRCVQEPQIIDGRIVDMKLAVPEGSQSIASWENNIGVETLPRNRQCCVSDKVGDASFHRNFHQGSFASPPSCHQCEDNCCAPKFAPQWWNRGETTISTHQCENKLGRSEVSTAEFGSSFGSQKCGLSPNEPCKVDIRFCASVRELELMPLLPSPFDVVNEPLPVGKVSTAKGRTPLGELTNVANNGALVGSRGLQEGMKATKKVEEHRVEHMRPLQCETHYPKSNPPPIPPRQSRMFIADDAEEMNQDYAFASFNSILIPGKDIVSSEIEEQTECPLVDVAKLPLVDDTVSEKFPSAGSALHASGECRRCNFFSKGRCQSGENCTFCHFVHEKHKPRRRERRERQAAWLLEQSGSAVEGMRSGGSADESQPVELSMHSSICSPPAVSAFAQSKPILPSFASGVFDDALANAAAPPGLSPPLQPVHPFEISRWQQGVGQHILPAAPLTVSQMSKIGTFPMASNTTVEATTTSDASQIFSTIPANKFRPLTTSTISGRAVGMTHVDTHINSALFGDVAFFSSRGNIECDEMAEP